MKRSDIEQLQTNGREVFGILIKRGEQYIGNGRLEIARKIERSISYMLQHLNQPLHVATLAAAVNVSPSHYSALFKRLTGTPPIDYFIHLRMQHACQLFDSTSLNVKEVAAALGYDDPFYFSRTFKAVNHVPPSEYRMMPEKLKNTLKSAALTLTASYLEGSRTIQGGGGGWIPGCELVKSGRKLSTTTSGFGTNGEGCFNNNCLGKES